MTLGRDLIRRSNMCQLNFRTAMDQGLLSVSHFPFWKGICIAVILSLSHHWMLVVSGADHVSLWSQTKNNYIQAAVLKELHLKSLIHTWTWFRGDSGFWAAAVMGWHFWKPWDGVSRFYMWEKHESLGAGGQTGSQPPKLPASGYSHPCAVPLHTVNWSVWPKDGKG